MTIDRLEVHLIPNNRQHYLDNLVLNPTPIPEPTTLLLLGTGLIGVGVRRYRRKP